MYYFAYGSNMRAEQMAWRCPQAKPIAKAFLPHHHFRINKQGAATIFPYQDHAVMGIVWKCSLACIKTLDSHEQVSEGIYRKALVRIDVNGTYRNALTYIARCWQPSHAPARGYLTDFVIKGAEDFGIETGYIDSLWGWQGDHVLKKGRRRPLVRSSQWKKRKIKRIANS